jgi:alkaline phosphatase D
VTWDDHEVVNNYAGTVDPARRDLAYRAWWEHQPTRLPKPDGSPFEIHRSVEWGALASFFVLDGRQYRDDQPCDRSSDLGAGCDEQDEPERTMLGAAQEAWVAAEMPASMATWNVLAQQTIVSPSGIPLGDSEIFNLDQWDGYPAARGRLLDVLAQATNAIVITGDIHASAIGELLRRGEYVATELVGTSMSSSFPEAFIDIFEAAATAAGAKLADARSRGYVLCDVTPDELRADYRVVSTVLEPTAEISTAASWVVPAGYRPGTS